MSYRSSKCSPGGNSKELGDHQVGIGVRSDPMETSAEIESYAQCSPSLERVEEGARHHNPIDDPTHREGDQEPDQGEDPPRPQLPVELDALHGQAQAPTVLSESTDHSSVVSPKGKVITINPFYPHATLRQLIYFVLQRLRESVAK